MIRSPSRALAGLAKSILAGASQGGTISDLIRKAGLKGTSKRHDAVRAMFGLLARRKRPVAVSIARQALDDPVSLVRAYALAELRRRNARLSDGILERLLQDRDPGVREEVVETLALRGGLKARRMLRDSLKDADRLVRNTAAESLISYSAGDTIRPLARLLKDPWIPARCSAAETLGGMGSPEAIPYLRRALRDRSEIVRGYVMTSLGRLRDLRSKPLIEKLNGDGTPRDRLGAVVALYLMGDRGRLDELRPFLKSRDKYLPLLAGNELVWMVRREDIRHARRLLLDARRDSRNAIDRANFSAALKVLSKHSR